MYAKNCSLINNYIQDAYYRLDENNPIHWMEYENIVNTALLLGQSRDGVYSDVQKSYIIKKMTDDFIEKSWEERDNRLSREKEKREIMSTVQQELENDTKKIVRSEEYVKELFEL